MLLKILDAYKQLKEYAWIVEQIRKNEGEIENVIDRAISDMPDDFEIKPYLMAHRAEMKGMLLTEYIEAATMELFREEGRQEGFLQALIHMVRRKKITIEETAREADMTLDAFAGKTKKA